ncbi:MAG: VOC family protein [Puniceicoccales bacterium]|jgi:predicted enzyme related to lactoylglutathione lyase|nr:VOC family protein [Puniceicoccales bacterium]
MQNNNDEPYIEHFSVVPYPATDIARTRAFYGDVLDIRNDDVVEYPNGDWFIKYRLTKELYAIFSNHYKPIPGYTEPCLSFEVKSLDDYLKHLEKHGISAIKDEHGEILRKIPTGYCFRIADPDGHIVIIRHTESPKAETPKAKSPKVKAPKTKSPK